jgi:exodeoxyribonuclease VII small subunit
MAKEKQLTYQQAVAEIEDILQQMESNKTDVDSLSEKVKKALSLLNFCAEKLRATEEEIAQLQNSALQ